MSVDHPASRPRPQSARRWSGDALRDGAQRRTPGQIRNGSGGRPYIEHPLAVAELLAEHGFGDEVLAAALLHDVVEESEIGGRARCASASATQVAGSGRGADRRRNDRALRGAQGASTAAGSRPPARDAMAIYAADKLTNIGDAARGLRRAGRGGRRRAQGRRSTSRSRSGRPDLEMLRDEAPRAPASSTSSKSSSALWGGSTSGQPARASTEPAPQRQHVPEDDEHRAAPAAPVIAVVAAVPKRTSVISTIAPVIASARKARPAIAKRLARKTSRRFCWKWKVSRW